MDRNLAPAVKNHAGFSTCDYPEEIKWEGIWLYITKIIKQWREPGRKHFLVATDTGSQFKLVYSETNAHWLVSEVIIS